MELEPPATRLLRPSKSTTNDRHRSSIVDDLVSDKGLALLATPLASGSNSGHDGARFTVAAKAEIAAGSGARARIRTWGLPLRRRSLYPTELHALIPNKERKTTNARMACLHTATHVFTATLRRFDLAVPVRALGDINSCAVV